jgi:hypothetical protein
MVDSLAAPNQKKFIDDVFNRMVKKNAENKGIKKRKKVVFGKEDILSVLFKKYRFPEVLGFI